MRCGLFGKLSAKRDFIAVATPHKFLEVWEHWVQACMSASQHQLGSHWQNAFLTAPLWRFWLGADLCGATVLGVLMSSVDGVGRYYPLTLLAVADESSSIPPPDLTSQDQWFAAAEDFLLSTLDQSRAYADILAALEAIPAPQAETPAGNPAHLSRLDDRTLGAVAAGVSFQEALATLRRSNHGTSAAASYWWTGGGADFPPLALVSRGLPDPFHYSKMMTGRLVDGAIERA